MDFPQSFLILVNIYFQVPPDSSFIDSVTQHTPLGVVENINWPKSYLSEQHMFYLVS